MKHERSKTLGDTPDSHSDSQLADGMLVAGKYRLMSQLGRGGMGEVWSARHEELNSDVAIKFALLDEQADIDGMFERFRFEAQVSAQLSQHSDHIIKVFDAGRHRGTPYMVMELIEGRTLDALLEDGPLTPAQVADVLDQLARALTVAHDEAIWHRDIKAENIMISERRDGRWHIKLTDFGVAKALEERLEVERPKTTETGVLVGTPHYMSPEQLSGYPVDGRSDLWSLAIVAYESLTGSVPFDGATSALVITSILTKSPPPLDRTMGLPRALEAWFDKALDKAPANRFTTASELAETFRVACRPRARSSRLWAVAAGVVVLAAAATSAFVAAGSDESTDVEPLPSATSSAPEATAAKTAQPERPAASSADSGATATPSAPPPRPTAPPRPAPRPPAFDPSEVQ